MKLLNFTCILSLFSVLAFGQINGSSFIDSLFLEWDQPNTPGCGLGIIKNGELVYAKGYGFANLEYDIPNSSKSVFRIGSTSKQFTAACIVLLAEQGKLSLEDTLKNIFPDFPDYAKKITIRQLLNHTSGIRDYLQLAYLKGLREDDYYTDGDIMDWLTNQTDLNFEPGEEFLYSNSGYWLLSRIVEKISGINMAQYAEKEIFKPLGMENTHFHNDHNKIVKNRASGYIPIDDENFQISMTTLNMIGDGGIFTTIEDIKKWDDAFYGSEVLSESFWANMTKQGVLNSGKEIGYASGLSIGQYKGLKTIRHGGAFVGFRAELLRFPEQKVSIAIFANRGDANPSRIANEVADIILKEFLEQAPQEEKEEPKENKVEAPEVVFELNQLLGDYELQPGLLATVSLNNDTLNVLQKWNGSTYPIVKMSGNTFQIPGESGLSFTFLDLKEGKTETLNVWQGGRTTSAKRKVFTETADLDLNQYEGEYRSEELKVSYTLRVHNEELTVQVNNQEPMDCAFVEEDKFRFGFGMIRFQKQGKTISGFELDSGRVNNVKFEKK